MFIKLRRSKWICAISGVPYYAKDSCLIRISNFSFVSFISAYQFHLLKLMTYCGHKFSFLTMILCGLTRSCTSYCVQLPNFNCTKHWYVQLTPFRLYEWLRNITMLTSLQSSWEQQGECFHLWYVLHEMDLLLRIYIIIYLWNHWKMSLWSKMMTRQPASHMTLFTI